eukprot:CAMPEP_0115556782 /NCGR_PEP_ID=MMETSP0271-20121206/98559_1 /TAXON_ID=71861 /ORGANISM="Scrippsiella trochoidea, Strain CCMP3099" /LENGTH=69 /DNA_ID=CAMNT_0002990695 /DNA_START=1 /DNA_END=207 /DNA_ORIENTATION=+
MPFGLCSAQGRDPLGEIQADRVSWLPTRRCRVLSGLQASLPQRFRRCVCAALLQPGLQALLAAHAPPLL